MLMSRYTADQFAGRWKVTKARRVAICALVSGVVGLMSEISLAATPGLLLWNKLGSATEVLNSAYGPNLSFYNTPGGFDVVGNPAFVPGVFGNGVSIGPGNYSFEQREHTVVWSGVDQYLNPDRGTISVWYEQNSDPVGFDHGVYRIFDGSYGLGTGIGMVSQTPFPSSGPSLLYFGMDFGGTYSGVSYNISPFNGTWVHLAGVWDSDGIANSADTIRLYVNGDAVASATIGGWGGVVGQYADIAGGNDQNIAGQFAIDNLKVYDVALTDFSDRFNEGSIPEPASGCLGLIGLLMIGISRAGWRGGAPCRTVAFAVARTDLHSRDVVPAGN
jgi:Concanavalin A-like lectin/glucanases superfamily